MEFLYSLSLDGAAITTARIQRGHRLPGEQGQEEAQVKYTEKQVRHLHNRHTQRLEIGCLGCLKDLKCSEFFMGYSCI